MMKIYIFIFTIILSTVGLSRAEGPAVVTSVEPASAIISFQEKLTEIQKFEESANFIEAKKAYQALQSDSTLSSTDAAIVSENLQKLNMKILFSKIEMPESEIYTVSSGDSLYKIAKKFNTTIDLIKRSNNLSKDMIYPDQELKVINGTFTVKVDISETRLDLLLNNNVIKTYKIATGKEDSVTPEGQFKIVTKLPNPTWYRTGAIVAPDSPENILGTRWMGFDIEGYGIHGTTKPETIGQAASAGCIRMHNEDVEELYSIIPRGTMVIVAQ